jgi:SEC-C motif-containing protein
MHESIFKRIGILVLVIAVFSLLMACGHLRRNQEMSNTQQTAPRLLHLVNYHHQILRQVTETVAFPLSEQDKQLISDMKYSIQPEQLKKADAPWDAAVGMAANQWGINKRIFLFCPEGDTVNGLEVIINPSYEPLSETNTNLPCQDLQWEGCFSVPLATGNVQRYTHIKVKYQNEEGKVIVRELHDWPARVWQHENDHLNGLLYDDSNAGKCTDKKQFSSKEEVEKFYGSKKEEKNNLSMRCPCGTDKYYKDCCGVYLAKKQFPNTPEALMRSRYTAYVKEDMNYIQQTMRGPALLKFREQSKQAATYHPEEWLGLEVVTSYYDADPKIGYVEFIAKYKQNNRETHIHELSKFSYEEGQWYYIDGEYVSKKSGSNLDNHIKTT